MKLQRALKDICEQQGIDFLGIADIEQVSEAVYEQGGDIPAAFPRAVSIGIILPHAIVDQLPDRFDPSVALAYRHHAYDVINARLDQAASFIASFLQREGQRALPIPAAESVDDARLGAMFSHKMAARLAGLGWIGKSCLLVTPEAGPRVRWSTVLTHAPLETTGGPSAERCGDCSECVDICPVEAFTGRPFDPREPREARYDAHRCKRKFTALEEAGMLPVCGMCLYICPHGRK